MNENDLECELCEVLIPVGTPYICLNHNIEYFKHNVITNDDEIEVVQSEQILTLCASCGNGFDVNILKQILRTIPRDNSKINEN